MLRRATLVRTEVLEEHIASITRMTRIGELGIKLSVSTNRSTLQRNCHITEDGIFHTHRRENIKSYDVNVPKWAGTVLSDGINKYSESFLCRFYSISSGT
jgi:hypothetical protein